MCWIQGRQVALYVHLHDKLDPFFPVSASLLTPSSTVTVPPRLLPSRRLQPLQALNRGGIVRMPRCNDGEILQPGSHPLRRPGAQCRRDVHHYAALLRRRGNGDGRCRSSRRLRARLPGRPQDVCGYLVHQGG
jgi:hypothetical protein